MKSASTDLTFQRFHFILEIIIYTLFRVMHYGMQIQSLLIVLEILTHVLFGRGTIVIGGIILYIFIGLESGRK